MRASKGIIIPDKNYLKLVERLCRQRNIFLILDEVQTGVGRTGTFLASHKLNITPDIVCLGKGLAAGLPVGATVVSRQVAARLPRSVHTTTFGGNPLTMAVVRKVLELLDDKMLKRITKMGQYFIEGLESINNKQIIDIRGKGLMIGVEIKGRHTPVLRELQKKKILALPAGENVIRFLPSYIIEKKNIDDAVDIFKKTLTFEL